MKIKLTNKEIRLKLYRLSFGQMYLLTDDIAEFVVDDGIEISMAEVEEYHEFLQKSLQAPFSVLINKKNQYSYTLEAQLEIGTIAEMNALAILVYSPIAMKTLDYLKSLPRKKPWLIEVFTKREQALSWLTAQQATKRMLL